MRRERSPRSWLVRIGLGAVAVGVVAGAAWYGSRSEGLLATPAPTAQAAESRCPTPPVSASPPPGSEVGHQVSQLAPDFALANLAGKPVTLSSFRGCPVLLDFWASWCKPCLATMPKLETLRQRYQERGLRIVAVSLDYRLADAARYIEANGFTEFTVVWGSFAEARKVALAYGVHAIPRTILIDRQGIIRFVGHPRDLTDEIIAPWL